MSNSELCTPLTPVNTMKLHGSSNSWNSCRGWWEEKEGPPLKTEDGDNPKLVGRFAERLPQCGNCGRRSAFDKDHSVVFIKSKSFLSLLEHFSDTTFYSSNFTQRSRLSTPYIFQTGSLLSLLIISLLS